MAKKKPEHATGSRTVGTRDPRVLPRDDEWQRRNRSLKHTFAESSLVKRTPVRAKVMLVWRHELGWRKLIGKLWSPRVHFRRGGSQGQRRRGTVVDRETYRANGSLRTVTDCWFPSARPLRAFSLFRRHRSKQLRTRTWPVPVERNLDRPRTTKRKIA